MSGRFDKSHSRARDTPLVCRKTLLMETTQQDIKMVAMKYKVKESKVGQAPTTFELKINGDLKNDVQNCEELCFGL